MAPRVTVQDLRNEARARLKECSGGKTIGRMNKKQVLQLLDCFDDIALAREYRQQEEERAYDRAQTVPAGFFSEQKPRRKKQRVDDEVTLTRRPRKKKVAGSGHCSMTGSGHTTYREFVRAELPKHRAQGLSSQEAMRAVGAAWRKHKTSGSGLTQSGQGLTQAGDQDGDGFANELSKWSGRASTGLALAGAVQPEFAPVLEPAAAASKGLSYVAGLF